ncbi:MAG: hypothetical protein NOF05_14095 [Candidatus Accumulibacter phosphatis]|jgi:hypothetical protein|uniref:Uncharacterized protein n=1 Tax=Candidatus Accumulibacter cognatus TaxID=2954383 RepID=A0A080M9R8_9PROT|nr:MULTISPECIES: hypothetical protein [Candidatus Accumulibacter]MCQ1549912.1 hypothetical protein [Candidatus Accumulibacter phosphatis]KFB77988.1 MAG: hypothetical protein AW06_000660 [Candidatus Accumulibacter cognatus]MBN8517498.1 hypothetical protein [Accumulibacter sp.]MBO3711631.1 hypothetical protein [Accumulibacter sp.]QLH50327.1 MAG: hypothetical protein HWD57_11435 [Candidatus Accumulibacter cognatus]
MSDSARRWHLSVWVSLIILAGALLSLAPYMTSQLALLIALSGWVLAKRELSRRVEG